MDLYATLISHPYVFAFLTILSTVITVIFSGFLIGVGLSLASRVFPPLRHTEITYNNLDKQDAE